VEELRDDIGEVADGVDKKRLGESGVVSKAYGRRADETADKTDDRGADQYHDERNDAFDDVHRHDVVNSNHAELLKHPV